VQVLDGLANHLQSIPLTVIEVSSVFILILHQFEDRFCPRSIPFSTPWIASSPSNLERMLRQSSCDCPYCCNRQKCNWHLADYDTELDNRQDDWRNNPFKVKKVKNAIQGVSERRCCATEAVLELVKNQNEY